MRNAESLFVAFIATPVFRPASPVSRPTACAYKNAKHPLDLLSLWHLSKWRSGHSRSPGYLVA